MMARKVKCDAYHYVREQIDKVLLTECGLTIPFWRGVSLDKALNDGRKFCGRCEIVMKNNIMVVNKK